jgi:hypothetical protein
MVVTAGNAILGDDEEPMDAKPVDEPEFPGAKFLEFWNEDRRKAHIHDNLADIIGAVALIEEIFTHGDPVDAFVEAAGG